MALLFEWKWDYVHPSNLNFIRNSYIVIKYDLNRCGTCTHRSLYKRHLPNITILHMPNCFHVMQIKSSALPREVCQLDANLRLPVFSTDLLCELQQQSGRLLEQQAHTVHTLALAI